MQLRWAEEGYDKESPEVVEVKEKMVTLFVAVVTGLCAVGAVVISLMHIFNLEELHRAYLSTLNSSNHLYVPCVGGRGWSGCDKFIWPLLEAVLAPGDMLIDPSVSTLYESTDRLESWHATSQAKQGALASGMVSSSRQELRAYSGA